MSSNDQDLHFMIEVEPTSGFVTPEMKADRVIRATKETIADIARVIEENSAVLAARLKKMAEPPNEITVEFGVDARGEAGVPLVTKGQLGAQFKVTAKWVLAP